MFNCLYFPWRRLHASASAVLSALVVAFCTLSARSVASHPPNLSGLEFPLESFPCSPGWNSQLCPLGLCLCHSSTLKCSPSGYHQFLFQNPSPKLSQVGSFCWLVWDNQPWFPWCSHSRDFPYSTCDMELWAPWRQMLWFCLQILSP